MFPYSVQASTPEIPGIITSRITRSMSELPITVSIASVSVYGFQHIISLICQLNIQNFPDIRIIVDDENFLLLTIYLSPPCKLLSFRPLPLQISLKGILRLDCDIGFSKKN